jgi:RNA polymerase sigma-70 factor (ECF subfamily)
MAESTSLSVPAQPAVSDAFAPAALRVQGESAALEYPREWVQPRPARPRYVGQAEADLIAGCIAGDQTAWEALISRYQTRVFNVTYHMTQDHDRAADLAQEAFIQILKSLSGFRGEASLSTWIHGLTIRVCLHHMRRERRRQMESWEDAVAGRAEPETSDGRPHETISREQLQGTVRNAISQLPLKFRSVMVLHGLAGMTYEETAAALGLPLNTVKTRVHRAKAKLKTRLQGTLGEDGNGL